MPKYINADEMFADESEAYMRAQTKITDEETYIVNHFAHMKVQQLLYDTPAADVAPVVHGRWEWDTGDIYRCTACNRKVHVVEVMCRPVWDYCPNCGARMGGGDDGEAD